MIYPYLLGSSRRLSARWSGRSGLDTRSFLAIFGARLTDMLSWLHETTTAIGWDSSVRCSQ